MESKKIFILRPVRNVTEEVKVKIVAYVAELEKQGHEVYDPERDNPYQDTDKIGIQIISHNCRKMIEADEIHIWYDKSSTGSIFDIGMFYMFVNTLDFKKFVIINQDNIVPTPHKSFENVILALEKEFDNPMADGLKDKSNLWDKEYAEHNIASSFKGTISRSVTFLKEFLEKSGRSLTGLRVLDCGCGNGRNAIPLAIMGNSVFGIDISENAIKDMFDKIQSHKKLRGKLVFSRNSMADPLKFPRNYFDVVADITSFDILLGEEEIDTHRKEVWRVLKSNGLFLYYDMDASDPYSLWLKSEGRVKENDVIVSPEPGPISFKIYSLEEVVNIFSNFDLITSELFRFKDVMYGREHDRAILCAIFSPKNKVV